MFHKSNIFFKYLFIVSISALFLSSCVSKKEIVYFQESRNLEKLVPTSTYESKLQVDDLLGITVSAENPASARPFNINQVSGEGDNASSSSLGYLISAKGTINFPVVGSIKLAGLSRSEAIELIRERLKEYINDPIVIITIKNFKITVIGEVRSPGSYTIPNERLTIIEAIGLAGDLTIKGMRKNITVIRDADGVKQIFKVDITSKTVFDSPVYYLAQNDVVYVEPNSSQVKAAGSNQNLLSIFLSVAGLGISIATLLNTAR
jgi:polysaccharide export outer membrane protein